MAKKKGKKIIDPTIINFLFEHLKTSKVDFSKIKISAYLKRFWAITTKIKVIVSFVFFLVHTM